MKKALHFKKCLLIAALAFSVTVSAQTIVVSECNLNGWTTYTEPTGTLAFVNGPSVPPLGSGSLQLSLGTIGDGKAAIAYNDLAGTPLSALRQLMYATYVQVNNSGQAPALELAIDNNGDGTPDDQLVFEPVYQTGDYPGVIQNGGMVTLNTWQTWNGMTGGWWAASDETAGPSTYTLASYIQAHPSATIADIPQSGGVILTGGGGNTWDNFIGYADALVIGTTGETATFDFEACAATAQRITLCHKGQTIHVAQNAVPAHVKHGDLLGTCATTGNKAVVAEEETAYLSKRFTVTNYPNPFTSSTRILYSLPENSRIALEVFDAAGRRIATLVNRAQDAGDYAIDFHAGRFGKGVYYYTLRAQSGKQHFSATKSMTILR